ARPLGRASFFVLALRSFFFQAEDGIRDATVTGVQTCALPISSSSSSALQCPSEWHQVSATVPAPATDDHPFLYLQDRTIPGFYLLTLALILLSSLLLVRVTTGSLRPMGRYLDLFCMGAAFLLLETKNRVALVLRSAT